MKIAQSTAAAVLIAAALSASPAFAGPYEEAMKTCIAASATKEDQQTLSVWMFASMAANPAVSDMAAVSAAENAAADSAAIKVIERLILTDCRKQVVETARFEGVDGALGAFDLLAEIAASGLIRHPAVAKKMADTMDKSDQAQWAAVLEEAKSAQAKPTAR